MADNKQTDGWAEIDEKIDRGTNLIVPLKPLQKGDYAERQSRKSARLQEMSRF